MLTNTSKTRLLKLAAVIEQLPTFLSTKKPTKDIPKLTKPIKRFDLGTFITCGTAACALGTAALHPWFRLKGLKDQSDEVEESINGKPVEYFTPVCNGKEAFEAGSEFFGINDHASNYLFNPNHYPSSHKESSYVANRIRQFVKNDGYFPYVPDKYDY